jgi:acetolactate synthase I/II/III large subunit
MPISGAELVVKHLEAQKVTHVFGVPGAKIDRVYDALHDSSIQTVVCRDEQNASFIAQGIGRLTGKAGVCLVTSGPGTTNLVTGFATATSEGSPVVGLGGVVPRAIRLKQAHQSLDTAALSDTLDVEHSTLFQVSTAGAPRWAEIEQNKVCWG